MFGPTASSTSRWATSAGAARCRTCEHGPVGPGAPDDQFGGPEPDNAHLTGVILRLNDDGTTPRDNPFYKHGARVGGEVGANIQKIFAYGLRNGFGMAFDPVSGDLWEQENGDDSFSELNRVEAGMNSGWVQIMGPPERIGQYKEIETSPAFFGLQQIRWPPDQHRGLAPRGAGAAVHAAGRPLQPARDGLEVRGRPRGHPVRDGSGLGSRYRNDLIMGGARPFLEGGHLFRLELSDSRRSIAVTDPRLRDRVADNVAKFEITESESLLFGRNFGTVVDLKNGPNGNLFAGLDRPRQHLRDQPPPSLTGGRRPGSVTWERPEGSPPASQGRGDFGGICFDRAAAAARAA